MLTQYNKLFEKAIRYWGIEKQLSMVAEENNEINLLLEKQRRHGSAHMLSRVTKNPDGSEEVEKIAIRDWLAEECADGLIMLTQLALILGAGKVWSEIERKIDRLKDKIFEIDCIKKEIKCADCGGTFILEEEIAEDLECEHCSELLSKVGYEWVKFYGDEQGWTENE